LVESATERPDSDCILAFITSRAEKTDATDLVLDVSDADFVATGLNVASAIRCGKLMTLDRSLLTGRLGRLSERLMGQVNFRLKEALALI
jgi:mRNA interferase MazF